MDGWKETGETVDFLRKKDLHEPLEVPKSTIADWLTEFHVFIPTIKHGNVTYYKMETLDVLKYIKSLRERNYSKPQIMVMLSEKGFPITVEEAVEDVRKIMNDGTYRDTLMTVMQTMGQAVTELADQNKALQAVQQEQNGMNGRITEVEQQIKKLDEVEVLRLQIEELRSEIAATKEEAAAAKNKSFFSRLFNK